MCMQRKLGSRARARADRARADELQTNARLPRPTHLERVAPSSVGQAARTKAPDPRCAGLRQDGGTEWCDHVMEQPLLFYGGCSLTIRSACTQGEVHSSAQQVTGNWQYSSEERGNDEPCHGLGRSSASRSSRLAFPFVVCFAEIPHRNEDQKHTHNAQNHSQGNVSIADWRLRRWLLEY